MVDPTNMTDHLVVRGTAVSTGVAQGPAFVLAFADHVAVTRRTLDPGEVVGELERLDLALAQAEQDLLTLSKEVAAKVPRRRWWHVIMCCTVRS